MARSQKYFEQLYNGPWKGVNVAMPENLIDPNYTPDASNWIPRAGELRTRPRHTEYINGLSDNSRPLGISAFIDENNVVHTVCVSNTGLWQLNSLWRNNKGKEWNLVGRFASPYALSNIPASIQVFLTQLFFVVGDNNLWTWNGITPSATSPGNALQSIAIISSAPTHTTGNLLAGAQFLGELDSRLILLSTIEQQDVAGKPSSAFPQRIRWSASGLPNVWDPTVNVGAGFNDEIDVPDVITGFMAIGRNGFVFRVNGISEMISISQGVLPFDFNHLWASDRGIGNVYPFSIANYGPVGCFISTDDIYELSLGGFKKIGGMARNKIYEDLALAVNTPIASMFGNYALDYPYLTYKIMIPLAGNICKHWCYFVEDDCWFPWTENIGFETGYCRVVPTL